MIKGLTSGEEDSEMRLRAEEPDGEDWTLEVVAHLQIPAYIS
jgi:hypothetical protein